MKTRIHEVPACLVETIEVEAKRYNQIHLALLRLGAPLRFQLTGLRNLDILLDYDCWVCVDRSALDLPVIAWNMFENQNRDQLQQPVTCQLRHYQVNTDILLPYMWMTLESILATQLAKREGETRAEVLSISRA